MMKKLLLISIISFNLFTYSQNNLIVNNNSISWQHVYDLDSVTTTKLVKTLNTIPSIKNIQYFDNQISAEIEGAKIDYEKYGGKTLTTLTILNYNFDAKVIIDIKENKYRVTVLNMLFTDNWSVASQNTFTNTRPEKLSDYVLKKDGSFKKGKTYTNGLSYLDQDLLNMFTYTKSDNDW